MTKIFVLVASIILFALLAIAITAVVDAKDIYISDIESVDNRSMIKVITTDGLEGVSGCYYSLNYTEGAIENISIENADLNFSSYEKIDRNSISFGTVAIPSIIYKDEIVISEIYFDMVDNVNVWGSDFTFYDVTYVNSNYVKEEINFINKTILFTLNGDVDNNGIVNLLDGVLIINYIFGYSDLEHLELADYNNDDIINLYDALNLINDVFWD